MALDKDARGMPLPKGEEMITTPDNRSMRRGRRVAPRTEVCRPCLLWREAEPDRRFQGVVLDLNPHGMRIRMLEAVPEGTKIFVQMMRDDEFRVPLSPPLPAVIRRCYSATDGFMDHGVRVIAQEVKRPEEMKPVHLERPKPKRRTVSRMHTVDYTIGEHITRKTGKNRG